MGYSEDAGKKGQESMQDEGGRHNMDETYAKIIARAWSDPEYKARLLSEPKAVLIEAGMKIDDDVVVAALESSPTHLYFVLPSAPEIELAEDDLEILSAAYSIDFGGGGGGLRLDGSAGDRPTIR